MTLYKHCLIDPKTNLVVNVIEYDKIKTGAPPGLDENLICVYDPQGTINAKYENGKIINPPSPPTPPLPLE